MYKLIAHVISNKKIIRFSIILLCILNVLLLFTSSGHIIITTYAQPEEWPYVDFSFRKPIFINNSLISDDLLNFTFLVDITDSHLAVAAEGNDIFFTDEKFNMLNFEIVRYNKTNGNLIAWINVPKLNSKKATILYLYYGNSEASHKEEPENVWDSNYVIVYHLDEVRGLAIDSTGKGNNGLVHDGIQRGEKGLIDKCYNFYYKYMARKLEVIQNTNFDELDALTTSFWIKVDMIWHNQTILSATRAHNELAWFIGYRLNNNYRRMITFIYSDENGTKFNWDTTLYLNMENWYHVTVVLENGIVPKFYVNGEEVRTYGPSITKNILDNMTKIYIGKSLDLQYLDLDGKLDEIRISNIARSPDWIATEYKNQHNPSSFLYLGEHEEQPSSPIIYDAFPIGLANMPETSPELNFSIMDFQDDLMNYTVSTSPDIGRSSGINVGNGRYSVQLQDIKYYQTYECSIELTDGTHTINKIFTFTPAPPGDDVIPPKARGGPDMIIEENQLCQFNGSRSTDNVDISNYTWIFYDYERTQILQGVYPSFTFSKPGKYPVTLTVTDFSGNQGSDFFLVEVKDVTRPIARALTKDDQPFIGNVVTLDAGDSTDNVNVTYYEWDLGDGTIIREKRCAHVYSETGTYNVTLTVKDAEGNVGMDWLEITINPRWGHSTYLSLIFIGFVLVVIYLAYRTLFISKKPRSTIYKIE